MFPSHREYVVRWNDRILLEDKREPYPTSLTHKYSMKCLLSFEFKLFFRVEAKISPHVVSYMGKLA